MCVMDRMMKLVAALVMVIVATACTPMARPCATRPLDPVALASEFVTARGMTNLDLTTGKIIWVDDDRWVVSFTDPEMKRTGWKPCTRNVQVDRGTGSTKLLPAL